jgi:hypothetical protein
MKQVTMTRDMRPFRAREEPVVPDVVAAQLVADGAAENPRPWPRSVDAMAEVPPPTKGYKVKGAGK